MADRYFVEEPIEGQQARLTGGEAHHLAHVMRAHVGDAVALFDGRGAEFTARVEQITRSEIVLTIVARHEADRELAVEITLGVALPKGDRRRWLVEKSVELGVARLVPLETARASDREPRGASGRLRQAVVEASKQCGRNRLMQIADVEKLPAFLAACEGLRLMAHVGAEDHAALDEVPQSIAAQRRVALAVGPEGGFTDEEVALARSLGWRVVRLGRRVLRVETAALALVAKLSLGD
jgi:16S rRNA (uracil1498-N3)-methyltransferase